MKKITPLLVLCLLAATLFIPNPALAADTIIFASSTGITSGSCQNWENACDLQYALSIALPNTEIWVKSGTYKPGTNRVDTFTLKDGVEIYGGFLGNETDREERDWVSHLTILSGNIDSLDDKNSYHVVTASGTNSTAILDGFVITLGYADGSGPNESNGGGMLNISGSPTIANVIFQNNYVDNDGGGMYNSNGSNPTLTNIVFDGNEANQASGAYGYGGGMHNDASSPTLANVRFSSNSAVNGGGMSNINGSAPSITQAVFELNQVIYFGGGLFNNTQSAPIIDKTVFVENNSVRGGAVFNIDSTATIANTLFHKNTATARGGAILNLSSNSSITAATISVMNSTFYENQVTNADTVGGGLANESSLTLSSIATLVNNIFWGNTALNANLEETQIANVKKTGGPDSTTNTTYNIIQYGGWPGSGNLITDPLFVSAGNSNFHLQSSSPAIDNGTIINCPAEDMEGISRPQTGTSGNPICDIGAYEFVIPDSSGKVLPDNGAIDQPLSIVLSWESNPDANQYEYCYSSSPGPCTKWNSVGVNTSVTLNDLSPNYTYYWQIRINGITETDSGIWWSFTTTAVSACTWPFYTPPVTPTFIDVPMTVGHWNWVERLANSTITAGCGSGNFCPLTEVTRAQMAIFLLRGKHCGNSYTPPAVGDSSGFGDVSLTASYAAWVKQLATEGITVGCGNGNFCPQQVVNRAQMAIFLLRAKHGATYSPPAVGGSTGFNDVSLDVSYAPWVKQLAVEGVTSGCGNDNFCPLQNVNRAQMATFLVRAFNLP